MKKNNLAIIILSCDKFSSLWPIFFKRLDRFFPQNNEIFYLLSNEIDSIPKTNHSVEVVCVGDDISWSDNLISLLKKIPEDNLLLLIEDGIFSKKVNLELFYEIFNIFLKEKMNYLNLKSRPKPDIKVNSKYGKLSNSISYRTALVPSLWKKEVLLNLLKRGESAWEFEVFGSTRSKDLENFYSLENPIFSFDHLIVKGKLDFRAQKMLLKENENVQLGFPLMNFFEFIVIYIKEKISYTVYYIIPKSLIPRSVLAYLGKLKYKNN